MNRWKDKDVLMSEEFDDDVDLQTQTIVVKLLLEHPKGNSINWNAINTEGWTPFMMACANGNSKVVQLFIDHSHTKNIDLNAKVDHSTIDNGYTGFMFACGNGQTEVVETILDNSAIKQIDLNVKDCFGRTALFVACSYGKISVVKLLIDNPNIDLNAKDNDGVTPFMIMCIDDNLEVIKLFLKHFKAT